MFFPTKATVKLDNGNTGHAQGIGIILCHLPNCSIIYPEGSVYYYLGHPYNTISSGALRFYVGFQKFTSEPLEHCDSVQPQVRYWISSYPTQNNIDYLQIENFKVNPQIDRNVFPQLYVHFQNKIFLSLFISVLVMSLLLDLKKWQERTHRKYPRKPP